ncbi:AAA family ATPase [Amycolatopsis suaedae]|uniref:AAA family ATPase n=1 Tax=Amycolatopsis suaedae TaxID=2510978 RepID=UPI0013EEF5FF|nr:AAA family ATPase [Amycolatopsis suaedae]
MPRDVVNRVFEFGWLGDELAAAHAGGHQAVVVVTGPPGVGKTAVVASFAQQKKDGFPDGVLFATLGASSETVSQEEVLRRFLWRLGMDKPPELLADLIAAYQDLTAGKKLVVVLDDVESPAQLKNLLPNSPHSLVLATSRKWAEGFEVEDFTVIRVEPFDRGSSVKMLSAKLSGERLAAATEHLPVLAELCGHLPLALRVANARLRARRHQSIADFVEDLRAAPSLTRALTVDDSQPVADLFDVCYAELSGETQGAHRLLSLHPGARFGLAAAAALLGSERPTAERVLDGLVQANLLTRVDTGRYEQHSLLRDHAAGLRAEQDHAADCRQAVMGVVEYYLEFAVSRARSLSERLMFGEYFDRVTAAYTGPDAWQSAVADLELEQANLRRAVELAEQERLDSLCWQLCAALSTYLFQLDLHNTALSVCAAGFAAAERIARTTGDARPLLTTRLQRGTAYFGLKDNSQAAREFELAAELAEELPADAVVVFTRAKLCQWRSFVHQRLGENDRAVARILEARELVLAPGFPEEHRARELALVGLNGATMLARAGRHAEAVDVGRQAVDFFSGGPELHNVAKATANLGEALTLAGGEYLVEAERLLRDALAQETRLRLTSWRAHTTEVLAGLLERTGRADEARQLREGSDQPPDGD